MTIADFLLARIAEDEAVAHEAAGIRGRTRFVPGREPEVPDLSLWANDDVLGGATVSIGPERVLSECEAKRRLVELHEDNWSDIPEMALESCTTCGLPGEYDVPWPCPTIRALAAVYADHPDYDEAWRP